MSAQAAAPPPTESPDTGAGPGTLPAPQAEDRGRLDVHPSVLRKIVEYAADRVPGTLHRGRTLAGFDVGDAGIKATITTTGVNTVDIRLDLALTYPAPVHDTVAAIREQVASDLERIAGHRVRSLAVNVSGLRGASAAGPRLQ